MFVFDAFYGDALDLDSISKEGYIITTKTRKGYLYGPLAHHYVPNPLQPVIYHMWKTNGAVPLFRVDISIGLPKDGTAVAIDLRRKRRVTLPTEDTDLRVTLRESAPPGQRNSRTSFDWSFALKVPDGGVVETRDEFTYLAPEEGYQSRWGVEYHKDQADWQSDVKREFYLRNHAGQQYGWLSIRIRPDAGYPAGYLVIDGYLNPAGRVLEYDARHPLYPPPLLPPVQYLDSRPVPPAAPAVVPGQPPGAFPPPGAPNFPQPPPGFQAFTNRAKSFVPPAPPRPPP